MVAVMPASSTEGGTALAFPDTGMTPGVSAGAPGPLPYPNNVNVSDGSGSSKVLINNKDTLRKGDEFRMSAGDEAGNSPGGVVSGGFKGKGKVQAVVTTAGKVKAEGGDIAHVTCITAHNGSNANMPAGAQLAPSQTKVMV